ncbi:MAG: universal stress protein [Edaphocola sp.]
MKQYILVYTRFTAISRNAVEYGCALAADRNYSVVLVHNYTPEMSYAADAIALASMQYGIADAEEQLVAEHERAKTLFPSVDVQYLLTVGQYADAVQAAMDKYPIHFLVTGAPESGGDFWAFNDTFVDVINDLPLPVLVIPMAVTYREAVNIGFACDYATPLDSKQIKFIEHLMESQAGAQLHVIHVSVPGKLKEQVRQANQEQLATALARHNPKFANIVNNEVIASIIGYVRKQNIQLLLVIPHRHGLWFNIFNQSHTRRLTRINHLPILALQDTE